MREPAPNWAVWLSLPALLVGAYVALERITDAHPVPAEASRVQPASGPAADSPEAALWLPAARPACLPAAAPPRSGDAFLVSRGTGGKSRS